MTRPAGADAGFTLVELIAALAVIAVVLASVAAFLVRSMTLTHLQGDRQTAVQLASDGMERIRAVPGSQVGSWLPGELPDCVAWPQRPPTDPNRCALAAGNAASGTRVVTVRRNVDEIRFAQIWRVTRRAIAADAGAAVDVHQIVVRVEWPAQECGGTCAEEATTLISESDADPIFNTGPP